MDELIGIAWQINLKTNKERAYDEMNDECLILSVVLHKSSISTYDSDMVHKEWIVYVGPVLVKTHWNIYF